MERRVVSAVSMVLLTLGLLVSAFRVVPDVAGDVWMSLDWSKTYGGTSHDRAYSMIQTSDGGYAIAGYTNSFGAGNEDFWLVKTDSAGNHMWNRTYGGTGYDEANSLVQTADGGYAIAGYTNSFGAGNKDLWLVKTDSLGNQMWNRTYGGTGYDEIYSLVRTVDGGYTLAGYTTSYGAGSLDFWLVKTDSSGNMAWNRTYGGTDGDQVRSLVQTADGGYAMAGFTEHLGIGSTDLWLVKTDSLGNQMWNRTYGGSGYDEAYSVIQTVDGYAIAGFTSSLGTGGDNLWLIKTDLAGNALWNSTYGGPESDGANSVIQTVDGGYAMAGYTDSLGYTDSWLVKTDAAGNQQWNKTYGGTDPDYVCTVVQTSDGGYALAGRTYSFGAGDWDFWLVKSAPATIYIRSDGSVDPPSARASEGGPIAQAGNYYALTDSIYTSALEGIVIQRSNIILDGAGFMLQGPGRAGALVSNGIRIQDVSTVTVQNMNIRSFDFAVNIEDSPSNIIQGNSASDCDVGIALWSSSQNKLIGNFITQIANFTISLNGASDNLVQENIMTDNDGWGIALFDSHRNNVTGNTISVTDWYGVCSYSSFNTTLVGNNIRDNFGGIQLQSSRIFAYHNNFMNNSIHVDITGSPSSWDDGYPSGGNYWSNYTGSDFYSGPLQNLIGSDGIGDTQHTLDDSNWDLYPLMEPWETEHISTRYDWPMFRCNLERNGYTRSPGLGNSEKLWNYTTDDFVFSSPAVVGRRVYVGSSDRNVYCLDALNGTRIWFHPTGGRVVSSPTVVNDRVYVGSYDRNVYCLSAPTGELSWNYTTGDKVSSSPAVVNGKVYVGSWDNKIYCLNALSGAYIWSYATSGPLAPCSPAVVDGRVVVGSFDGRIYCLNAETGAHLWSQATDAGVVASPAVVDDKVYIGSGDCKVYCFSALTGERIWNYTTGWGVSSSCAVSDGKVYVGSDDHKVYCLNALTGAHIWNYTTGGNITYSSPAISYGRLYVGSDDNRTYCLDTSDGTQIWNYTTQGYVRSSPAVADNVVYVSSYDGNVYALGSVIKVPDDYSTIQAAVDAANTGDTIVIAPGIYNESVVINKRLTIIGQRGSSTTFAGGGYGVAITISGLEASGTIIAAVTITNYGQGILVDNSANCRIYDNIMYLMGDSGIVLKGSAAASNIIYGNRIYGNNIGINLTQTSGNTIYSNTISQNAIGIKLSGSNGNTIYMNSFIGNYDQAISGPSTTVWDSGYPTGGNYWSNYAGVDLKNGPDQDLDGPDGIGDTPYEVSPGIFDRYPLMKPHDWIRPLGDANYDGNVNHDDLAAFSDAYGSILGMPTWNQNCDFHQDNKIEAMDLYHLGKNYGLTYP